MPVTITKTNARVGGAKVIWNSVQLGGTDAIELSIEGKTLELKMDQWGDQVLDEIFIAKEATVKIPLKECQIEQLKNVFGDWTITGATNKKVSFSVGIGTSLYSLARELTIERLSDPLTEMGTHEKITFPKAVPVGPYTEKFTFSGYNVYEVTFKVYVDMTTGSLGYRGFSTPS